jgi:hypothetical protein
MEIPPALRALLAAKPGSVILMDTSVYPGLVSFTGIPLRQTINESDLGIYRAALTAPATHAAIVLAFDGDEIDRAVRAHPAGLRALQRFTAQGQPSATLYVSDAPVAQRPRPSQQAALRGGSIGQGTSPRGILPDEPVIGAWKDVRNVEED